MSGQTIVWDTEMAAILFQMDELCRYIDCMSNIYLPQKRRDKQMQYGHGERRTDRETVGQSDSQSEEQPTRLTYRQMKTYTQGHIHARTCAQNKQRNKQSVLGT